MWLPRLQGTLGILLRAGHPELCGWAGSLSWGVGERQFPYEPPGNVLEPLLRRESPRSSTGISSLKERETQLREEFRASNPTVPTRDLNLPVEFVTESSHWAPEAEGGGEHTVTSALQGFLRGWLITTEFTKAVIAPGTTQGRSTTQQAVYKEHANSDVYF